MLIFSTVPRAPQMSGLISYYYKQAALPGGNSLAVGFLFVCFGFGGIVFVCSGFFSIKIHFGESFKSKLKRSDLVLNLQKK